MKQKLNLPASVAARLLNRARQTGDDYGWVDKGKGIVRIPLEDAMKIAPQLKGYLPVRSDTDKGDRKSSGGGQP